MQQQKQQSGFTLVEIIVVIAIMAIIGGIAATIIGRTLDSYAALDRRHDLQTSVRLAVERIAREVRHALPQSICVTDGSNCVSTPTSRVYFIPVKDSGRYQDRPGVYTAPPPIQRDRLPVTPRSDDRFDVLSTNAANRLNAAANDWIAVYNLNNVDIYLGLGNIRQQISSLVLKDINNDGNSATDIDQVRFAGNVSFANDSPSRRFHVIDNNRQVTLYYLNGSNLYRDTTSFAAPDTITANARLLMQNVSALSFTYTPGSLSRAGLLRIDLTVSKQGEQIQVIHNAHVFNTP